MVIYGRHGDDPNEGRFVHVEEQDVGEASLLVDVDEVAARHRRSYDETEKKVCRQVIRGREGLLSTWLNSELESRGVREVTERVTGRDVFLTRSPVLSVESVKIDGDELDDGDFERASWGVRLNYIASGRRAEVMYKAGVRGHAGRLEAAREVILASSLRAMMRYREGTLHVNSYGGDNVTTSYIDEVFTESELDLVRRARRPAVAP